MMSQLKGKDHNLWSSIKLVFILRYFPQYLLQLQKDCSFGKFESFESFDKSNIKNINII